MDNTAIEKPNGRGNGQAHAPGKPEAPISDIAAAVELISNEGLTWDEWNRIGMAIWRASGGSEEGFAIFDQWSAKCPQKYDPEETRYRWNHFHHSPPDSIGYGTLVYEARLVEPGWTPSKPPPVAQGGRKQATLGETAASRIAAAIHELNKHFAVVLAGNHVRILHELTDEDGRPTFELLTTADFRLWIANSHIELPDEQSNLQKRPLAPLWLNSPDRREFKGIVFKPGRATPGYYNLWRSFAVAPSEAGSCALFKAHLLDNVCKGDKAHFLWVFGWFAHIFQHPAAKCGTALVLRGKQGVGKTIVGKTFGHLIGDRIHYLKVASPRFVTGRFNAHLERVLLFHCDEAFWAGDHAAEGLIKDLITGEDHPIERKGLEVTVVDNYVRVLISGNADWLVPAGLDERRFAMLDVSEARQQDTLYFKAIVSELEGGGYERLMYELLSFDLSQVELGVIPKTAALLDQKLEALKPEQSWWFDTLRSHAIVR